MFLASMPCGNHQSCRSTSDPNMLVPSWEAAYRLSQVPFLQNELRRTQVVGRMQQFFVGENGSDALLSMNTRQFEFGLNYYLIDGLKASSSYGRQFSTDGNKNVWTMSLTYRFVVPLGHAGSE